MSSYYWIGLSDLAAEGLWSWLNNNTADIHDATLWNSFAPGTGSTENDLDCASVLFGEFANGLLAVDNPCSYTWKALCEKLV